MYILLFGCMAQVFIVRNKLYVERRFYEEVLPDLNWCILASTLRQDSADFVDLKHREPP